MMHKVIEQGGIFIVSRRLSLGVAVALKGPPILTQSEPLSKINKSYLGPLLTWISKGQLQLNKYDKKVTILVFKSCIRFAN